jgi:hypothetical protein
MRDRHDPDRPDRPDRPEERGGGAALTTADLANATEERERRELREDRPAAATRPEGTGDQPAGMGWSEPGGERHAPLLPERENQGFRRRWESIQTGFVDSPRRSVEEADQLVAEVMKRLAESFSHERSELERHWGEGDQASTEVLRQTLQRYRSFFGRLLSV